MTRLITILLFTIVSIACYAQKTIVESSNMEDGMQYLVIKVTPANATVSIDNKLQNVQNGATSVLLPKGLHTYNVEAPDYSTKEGTVEIDNNKKALSIVLESTLAQVSVSCPTIGAQIYVNNVPKGIAPWDGQLSAGNYQIEARKNGYRSQKQSVVLCVKEKRTISLPSLTAITGNINVNYQPIDAEVMIDGKKIGTSPDIFRNILIGSHSVEICANGYRTEKKTITVIEGATTQLSGVLSTNSSSTTVASSSFSSTGRTTPVPEAIDLGLSVKWASCNLGASSPEEYGNYYKWGETLPTDDNGWDTYKYAKGTNNKLTKYCSDKSYGNNGFTDGRTRLTYKDDAAAVNLGNRWRMPTKKRNRGIDK